VAIGATSPGQAGSAAMVSAIAEAETTALEIRCSRCGRILGRFGVSRVEVWLPCPTARHHSAAGAGQFVQGSGCSDAGASGHQVRQVRGRLGAGLGEMLGPNCARKLSLRDAWVDGVDELTESCDRGASADDSPSTAAFIAGKRPMV